MRLFLVRKIFAALFFSLISVVANATTVEYQFSGNLSGFTQAQFNSSTLSFSPAVQLTDTPFQITILGDTTNIVGGYLGMSNNGIAATWSINGIGTASTESSQFYTTSEGWVGIYWSSFYLTFNPLSHPAYVDYLSVPPTPLALLTSLANPPNMIPTYTTSVWVQDINNSVTLTGLSNVTYSVTSVPVPAAAWLLGSGLLGLVGVARRKAA